MKLLKEHFAEFNRPDYFSRADKDHLLDFHIGLDSNMQKCIELRCKKFKVRKLTGTEVIDVGQYKTQDYYSVRFTLLDDEMSGLFFRFCEDLIEETRSLDDSSKGYNAVIQRYLQWRKMFVPAKRTLLTEPEIMGLIGEILFLRGNLADRIGLSEALRSWSGQELTHKDFSYGDMWFESKAISRNTASVKISSLEQLDSENDGELVVHVLEKMSEAYDGIRLNNLVLDTMNMFSSPLEKEDFFAKTALQGYEYNTYYDGFVYEVSSFHRFLVNDKFPKLTRQSVDQAIMKASYVLSLPDLSKYELF